MKPATQVRDVVSSGELVRGTFGISTRDETHIMGILRDGLYTDKELAVLREYSSNAWDAHRDIGTPDKPIKVRLPTDLEPTLVIRDWGPGLSENDVFSVYTQYGASTKRDSDSAVGMLGIGSKSGFAYSDTFTVTSWHGGLKKIYIAVLDDSDRGEMNKLHEEVCGGETGVEIKIPVRPQDIGAFEERAKHLFTYFEPRPDINLVLPAKDHSLQKSGFISGDPAKNNHTWSYKHNWVAIMGCVPYKIDPNQFRDELMDKGAWDALYKLSGALFFDIGEVRISANREELKYTDKTRTKIAERARTLLDEYIGQAIEALNDSSSSDWVKRIKTAFLVNGLRLSVPDKYRTWALQEVTLWGRGHKLKVDAPKTFTLHRRGEAVIKLPIQEEHILILRDDPRVFKNFSIAEWRSTIVRPVATATLADVETELADYLSANNLDGIKITKLSDHPYIVPTRKEQEKNEKHRVKAFRLTSGSLGPWVLSSSEWEIEDRVPTDDDVYMIISRFKPIDYDEFPSHYKEDKKLAKWIGLPFPELYGYKTTAKKPLYYEDGKCKGTPYHKWRKTFFRAVFPGKYRNMVQNLRWAESFNNMSLSVDRGNWGTQRSGRGIRDWFAQELGKNHQVTLLFTLWLRGHDANVKLKPGDQKHIRHFESVCPLPKGHKTAPEKAFDAFYALYPLFKHVESGFHPLRNGEHGKAWLEYIKLIDRDQEKTS